MLGNTAVPLSSDVLTLQKDLQENVQQIVQSGTPEEQCLAIKTVGAWKLPSARDVLLEATKNDDPDVRADALETLVKLGEPGLGETFLWSLINDPIGESKIAALKGLTTDDRDAAGELLRKLAVECCDEDVAWDDEGADWDDWLDVQKEAIRTIGRLGLEDAVEDLLSAANDEFGQDVWREVLEAFARLGRPGFLALIDAGRSPSDRQRARAARAFGLSDDPFVLKALDGLSQDGDAGVRLAALETMLERNAPMPDERLIKDTDAQIRAFAASNSPTIAADDLIDLAMNDETKAVKLAAIARLCDCEVTSAQSAKLLEHTRTKLRSEPEDIIAPLIEVLGRSGTDEAFELLLEIGSRSPKPAVQRAILASFAHFEKPETFELLTEGITAKSQAVRLSALATLAALSREDGVVADNAAAVLLLAAKGDLASEEDEADEKAENDTGDAGKQFGGGAREDDGASRNRIVLDREGNIVPPKEETEDPVDLNAYRTKDDGGEGGALDEPIEAFEGEAPLEALEGGAENGAEIVAFPQSTLSAIMQGDEEQAAFEEEKIDLSDEDLKFLELAQSTLKKKRVRPDVAASTAQDIRRIAVRLIGELKHSVFTPMLLALLDTRDDELRVAAFNTLTSRCAKGVVLSDDDWAAMDKLPSENQPRVGAAFLKLLTYAPEAVAMPHLNAALSSNDSSIQAAALDTCMTLNVLPDEIWTMLASENRGARKAALKCVCAFCGTESADVLVQAAFKESGALSTELCNAVLRRGSCDLSDTVLAKLQEACATGGVERIIALQMLSGIGAFAIAR